MDDRSPDMLRSTLTAGVAFGTLGAIPYVRLINISCCCLLVTACGFLAAYLYSRECRLARVAFRPGAGATVGLIAGAFYALSQTLVGAVVVIAVGNDDVRRALGWLRQFAPPESMEQIDQLLSQPDAVHPAGLVLEFFMSLLVAAVVSTLGGLVGGTTFRVAPPAAGPQPTDRDIDREPPSLPNV